MKTLNAALILAKNTLASAGAWLLLVDVTLPDGATVFHLARNNEDVTFQGQLYNAFPFEFELPGESSKGELSYASLRVSNVTRILMPYMQAQGGGVGGSVTLHIVHSEHLADNTAELTMNFDVMSAEDDEQWVSWRLGAPSPLRSRYPFYTYRAEYCRWVGNFKGNECGYGGSEESCEGTLAACELYNNVGRFGGFPGLGSGSFKIV